MVPIQDYKNSKAKFTSKKQENHRVHMLIQRHRQHWEARKEYRLVASIEWRLSHGLAFWRLADVRHIMILDLVQFYQFLVQCLLHKVYFLVGDTKQTPHCPPRRLSNIFDGKGH